MDETKTVNQRYSLIGWGALFVWIGAISLLPGERVPFGLALLGIGLILLGINVARRAIHGLPVNVCDLTLGAIALAWGAAEIFRTLIFFPLGLIAIGLVLLIRSVGPAKTGETSGC